MGLFGKSRTQSVATLQIPDQWAERAALAYGNQQFASAFDGYAEAIDKLHTMYVAGECRVRQPGAHDDVILRGANNSLGATLAMSPDASVDGAVQVTAAYLEQIAAIAGSEGARYIDASEDLGRTLRLAR